MAIPDFTPTQFSSNEDKRWFVQQFQRFVGQQFPEHLFTKRFYNRLNSCRGHIAHTNQRGFWDEWFGETKDQCRFIEHWIDTIIYGDPAFTFSDVEEFLRMWLIESMILQTLRQRIDDEKEEQERAQLSRLQAKYPDAK